MNKLKYLAISLAAILLVSCETYKDPDVEYSPVYPLSGEYITWIYEHDPVTNKDTLFDYNYSMRIYNTTENTNDSVWVKISSASLPFGFRAKVACNMNDLTFSKTDPARNLVISMDKRDSVVHDTCFITGGKLMLKGASVKPSGLKPDSVHFTFEFDKNVFDKYVKKTNTLKNEHRKFIISGFRRTQWYMDELP